MSDYYKDLIKLADDLYQSAQTEKDRNAAKQLGEAIDNMMALQTGAKRECPTGNTIPIGGIVA